MSNRFSSFRTALGLAIAGGVTYAAWVRPWHLRWGASDEELGRHYPGDDLVPTPRLTTTHAITIGAPVADVWPWLAQLGQGRGGFYSYEWIENLMGADIHNADRILPEFQNPQVGDKVPLAKGGLGIPIALVEPERTLVLHGDTRTAPPGEPSIARPGNFFNLTWGFYLEPRGAEASRLVERWRADWNSSPENEVYMRAFLEPGAFIMERAMLLGIQRRAESLARRQERAASV